MGLVLKAGFVLFALFVVKKGANDRYSAEHAYVLCSMFYALNYELSYRRYQRTH